MFFSFVFLGNRLESNDFTLYTSSRPTHSFPVQPALSAVWQHLPVILCCQGQTDIVHAEYQASNQSKDRLLNSQPIILLYLNWSCNTHAGKGIPSKSWSRSNKRKATSMRMRKSDSEHTPYIKMTCMAMWS